jgi:hypothetical protein
VSGGLPREETAAPQVPAPQGPQGLLGRFREAKAWVAVCRRSLAAQELAEAGDEEVGLEHAIRQLQRVYDALDALCPAGGSSLQASGDSAPLPGAPTPRERWAEELGSFQEAISLIVVCRRSLAAQELAQVGDEDTVLRQALVQLRQVYDGFDALCPAGRSASQASPKGAQEPPARRRAQRRKRAP